MADYLGFQPIKSRGDYEALINEEPSSSGVVLSQRAATKNASTMTLRPSAINGDDDRTCLDVAISDGDGNGIDKDNPMPVYVTDSPATEIEDYQVDALAKNVSGNHDYTATSEFRGLNAEGSSAGLAKFELQVETGPATGVFETIMTKFNSVSNPNVEFSHKAPAPIASGVIIRMIKTNLDNQTTDVYSLINGKETV